MTRAVSFSDLSGFGRRFRLEVLAGEGFFVGVGVAGFDSVGDDLL